MKTKIAVLAMSIPTLCSGKVPYIDLCDIAAQSDVITLATVAKCETHRDDERCQLNARQDFKGTVGEAVCTDTSNIESRRLSGWVGKQVLLFLQRGKGCLGATAANRGVVTVVGATAYTGSIHDLGEQTEVSILADRLRACLSK